MPQAGTGKVGKGQDTVDLPPYCLGHLSGESKPDSDGVIMRYYDLYPLDVPRPAHGQTTATIACGTCGRTFSYTVSCWAEVRQRRQRPLAQGLALLLAGAGYIAGWVVSLAVGAPSGRGWIVLLSLLTVPALGLLLFGGMEVHSATQIIGVRLHGGDRDHHLRGTGERVDIVAPFRDVNGGL
jgi:hypothetical protein